MFIPYDIVVLLILSPFLLIIWIVVWVAVRLFPSGSFPCKMGCHTFIPDAALVGCQACRWYRLAVASICGVSTESLTGGK